MRIRSLHRWDLSPRRAIELQRRLAAEVRLEPFKSMPRLVAGADVSAPRGRGKVVAAVAVLRLPDLEPVEVVRAERPASFPYVPGLLSFREAPALLAAFRRLKARPGAVIFDGQGLAHMRGLGLACHMGLWLGVPSVGCAKSRLVGEHGPVGEERGSRTPLVFKDRTVGAVLRTRAGVKPVYVSPGHLTDVGGAVELVLTCTGRYRLPEPTRLAHIAAGEAGRREKKNGNVTL